LKPTCRVAFPLLLLAAAIASGRSGEWRGASGERVSSHSSIMAGYAPPSDTVRLRDKRSARRRYASLPYGAVVSGFLSVRGLPPRAGTIALGDGSLLFRSEDGQLSTTYPLVGPLRQRAGQRWRRSAVSLAYVDVSQGRRVYLFRVEGGVFETESPGLLLEVADRPVWLDSVRTRERTVSTPLVDAADPAGVRRITAAMEQSRYADTLYALFGRPLRSAGQVGERGRRAGRLGEYVAGRDSLALDPARMTSVDQLRHAFAHELGHRWQARSPHQLELLWGGIGPIKDPKRYGYGSTAEHQAEAIAFAVHFLQATAGTSASDGALTLLDHYELLVPGTSAVARYLALQPVYAGHPLRQLLTVGPGK
jgi:hypothetical protein